MEKLDDFKSLEKVALDLGVADAKVIPADHVVVENRVRLKCMVGCPIYGKNLKCPPYTPSVEEFRRILSDYSFAMVIKLNTSKSVNELHEEYNINSKETRISDLDQSNITSFSTDIIDDYKTRLMVLLELERMAFKSGYTFATVFFGGCCRLCEKCNVNNGECQYPMTSRFASEAMGINLSKTAENAGMELKFNLKVPTPMAVMLID
ncbi:MAG: DUF2284 domain-containing protein [Methanobacterium sp.]